MSRTMSDTTTHPMRANIHASRRVMAVQDVVTGLILLAYLLPTAATNEERLVWAVIGAFDFGAGLMRLAPSELEALVDGEQLALVESLTRLAWMASTLVLCAVSALALLRARPAGAEATARGAGRHRRLRSAPCG